MFSSPATKRSKVSFEPARSCALSAKALLARSTARLRLCWAVVSGALMSPASSLVTWAIVSTDWGLSAWESSTTSPTGWKAASERHSSMMGACCRIFRRAKPREVEMVIVEPSKGATLQLLSMARVEGPTFFFARSVSMSCHRTCASSCVESMIPQTWSAVYALPVLKSQSET